MILPTQSPQQNMNNTLKNGGFDRPNLGGPQFAKSQTKKNPDCEQAGFFLLEHYVPISCTRWHDNGLPIGAGVPCIAFAARLPDEDL
jgi:hypothetical protein